MLKTIICGIGFLTAGLVVPIMLEYFGIHIPFWLACVLSIIGIVLIVWGAIPTKIRDWSMEQVGISTPKGYKRLK